MFDAFKLFPFARFSITETRSFTITLSTMLQCGLDVTLSLSKCDSGYDARITLRQAQCDIDEALSSIFLGGYSAVGSALAWHARGLEFESR